MISRWRIITLSSLCIISTIACGFSAWVWTENNEPEVSVDVEVGEVFDDVVLLDTSKGTNNTGITCFSYCKDGFINNGEIDINFGYLYLFLKMNCVSIRKLYGNPSDTSAYTSLYLASELSFTPGDSSSFTLINSNYLDTSKDVNSTYTVGSSSNQNSLAMSSSISKGVLSTSSNGFNKDHIATGQYVYVTMSYRFSIDYTITDFETTLFSRMDQSKFNLKLGVGGY